LLELVGAAWHVSYLQKLYQRECRFVCTLAWYRHKILVFFTFSDFFFLKLLFVVFSYL
jgi:hypothetical protein